MTSTKLRTVPRSRLGAKFCGSSSPRPCYELETHSSLPDTGNNNFTLAVFGVNEILSDCVSGKTARQNGQAPPALRPARCTEYALQRHRGGVCSSQNTQWRPRTKCTHCTPPHASAGVPGSASCSVRCNAQLLYSAMHCAMQSAQCITLCSVIRTVQCAQCKDLPGKMHCFSTLEQAGRRAANNAHLTLYTLHIAYVTLHM